MSPSPGRRSSSSAPSTPVPEDSPSFSSPCWDSWPPFLVTTFGFAIGHFGGRPLVERFGRYILLTPERVKKATGFFERHGGKIVIIARFIEGLRQANGIIAGITSMHWARFTVFTVFNAIGAALWVALWTSVGYFSGNHIKHHLQRRVTLQHLLRDRRRHPHSPLHRPAVREAPQANRRFTTGLTTRLPRSTQAAARAPFTTGPVC